MKDIAIIGAGPSGLSAAIKASSEGLSVILIDSNEYGGQSGHSSNIENYPGFPEGITGKELSEKMVCQAAKFGVEFKCPFEVAYLERTDTGFRMGDGLEEIESKLILITTGITYKRLEAEGLSRYIGAGVYYGSPLLSTIYKNPNIVIVGGANSAGQAACYLSKIEGVKVKLIVRGDSVEKDMSTYLIDEVKECANIEILCNTTIRKAIGDTKLTSLIIEKNGEEEEIPVDVAFILIGGNPNTYWLKDFVERDERGFIITNKGLEMQAAEGIFVAGDVRAGSIKGVATSVGEGGIAINNIHKYLTNEKIPSYR